MFQDISPAVIEQHRPDSLIFLNNRVAHNDEVIAEYTQLMLDGFELDPVAGIRDQAGHIYIWDGWHRAEAAKRAGAQLAVKILPGTRLDAEWMAASANNKHGLRRTRLDKRHAIRLALIHPYGTHQSDRAIARHCGVTPTTVAAVRRELEEAGEIPIITRRLVQPSNGPAYWLDTQLADKTRTDSKNYPETSDDTITYGQVVRFSSGETWNDKPTRKCLGEQICFEQLLDAIKDNHQLFMPGSDGRVAKFCPHLRLFPQYIEQIVPDGNRSFLLDRIDCFCADPYVRKRDSCFNELEHTAMQAAIATLRTAGLPVLSSFEVKTRKKSDDFIWLEPQLNNSACKPETCLHAADNPPGYAVMAQPGNHYKMICLHTECGGAAQQVLVDHEAEQRRQAEQQRQLALEKLRQVTVEQTVFGNLTLLTPPIIEKVEEIIVPEWDIATMNHVLSGWKQVEIARLTGALDQPPADKASELEIVAQFDEMVGELADDRVKQQFALLRESMINTLAGRLTWLACLTLIRSWRENIDSVQSIEDVLTHLATITANSDATQSVDEPLLLLPKYDQPA